MVKTKALSLLRSAELTHDMSTTHLKKLASLASEVSFTEDEIICQQGEKGTALYLIESGEIVVETDTKEQGKVVMYTVGAGEFFGWSSLIPSERKMAWTRATKPTLAIAIDATKLQDAWQHDQTLETAVIRRAGRAMVDRIKDIRHHLAGMFNP